MTFVKVESVGKYYCIIIVVEELFTIYTKYYKYNNNIKFLLLIRRYIAFFLSFFSFLPFL